MLSGSFSIFRLPGLPGGPKEPLIYLVDTIQLVSCTNIVTLKADILNDTIGHRFYWEQISGQAVTFLEPVNQALVTFTNIGVTTDLIFRFWADKGTRFESYKDMIVANSARDDVITNYRRGSTSITTIAYPGVTNQYISSGYSSPGTGTINNTFKILSWTNPTSSYPLIYTKHEILKLSGGTTTVLATLPITASSYTDNSIPEPLITGFYVIRTWYDIYNIGMVTGYTDVIVPRYDATITQIDGTENLANVSYTARGTGSVTYYQTQLLTLENLVYTDTAGSVNYTRSGGSGNILYYQVQILTLQSIPDTLQDTPTGVSLNRYGTGSISIFQVQASTGITII